MRGRRSLLFLVALAAACADPAPIPDVGLRVLAGAEEVELGKAFPLTVVRTTAGDWSDDALAPLSVRLEEVARREDGERIEETRRYRAYAFTLADVTEPVELRVKPALDPEQPGPAELPATPATRQFPWWILIVVAAAPALLLLRRRRAPPAAAPSAPPAEAPPPGPHVRALERIRGLRGRQPQGHDELQSYYVEASGIVRDYVAERFAVNTTVMTTEELAAKHAAPADVLRQCDLVKFARHTPPAPDRNRMLDAAERFVRETETP